jgi:RHS repeat-associated protein
VEAFWIEPDQLDTPRAIVNATHQLIWQWDSDPFGTTAPNQNPTTSITTAFVYNLRFPGQYFDQESNTHYNYFRDYEPATGRYVESDPAGILGGIATFTYAYASPIDTLDSDGDIGARSSGREGHHSWPMFLGGPKKQKLAQMCPCQHQELHKDLNDHLGGYSSPATGKTMRPGRGNSGAKIRAAFPLQDRICALRDFYTGKGAKYKAAASTFLRTFAGGCCGGGGGLGARR